MLRDVFGYKVGAKAPAKKLPLRSVGRYAAMASPPDSVLAPVIALWRMMMNDVYGNCTWAGYFHARMCVAAILGLLTDALPTDAQIGAGYLTYNHGQDSGCCEADLLRFFQQVGFDGDRLEGFAPIDLHSPIELRQAIATFGAAYMGLQLPDSALPTAAGIPDWTMVPDGTPANQPNPNNGHCVDYVGYDATGVWLVTWGGLKHASWGFVAAYSDEGWALFTSEFLRANPGVVDEQALLADIEALGPIVSPNPLPSPSPAPVPAPIPAEHHDKATELLEALRIFDAVEHLAKDLEPFVKPLIVALERRL